MLLVKISRGVSLPVVVFKVSSSLLVIDTRCTLSSQVSNEILMVRVTIKGGGNARIRENAKEWAKKREPSDYLSFCTGIVELAHRLVFPNPLIPRNSHFGREVASYRDGFGTLSSCNMRKVWFVAVLYIAVCV